MKIAITTLALLCLAASPALAQYGPQLGGGSSSTTTEALGATVNNMDETYTVTGATFAPTADDHIIFVETDEDVTITLPTAINQDGRIIGIKDITGGAFDYPITIATEGSALIDGEISISISVAHTSFTLISNGTDWFIF